MHIVFSVDDKYIKPLCVGLVSLIKNTKVLFEKINIYILYSELEEKNMNLLLNIFISYKVKIKFVELDGGKFENAYVSHHIQKSAYFRILAPELLPNTIEKFLYLDSDLVIDGDIAELFSIDLEGKIIGAISDIEGFHRCLDLNITPQKYFNSGVLLVNSTEWKRKNVTKKVLNFIWENPDKLQYWDQDALNAVLYNEWKELDFKWNKQLAYFRDEKLYDVSREGIIHYTTSHKPWNIFCPHPQREMFEKIYSELFPLESLPSKCFYSKYKNTGKSIIIFGTGKLAEDFLKQYEYVQIECYLDNNIEKHGTYIDNVPVLSPEKKLRQSLESEIYICSFYYNEIKNQLESYGLEENKHFFKV